VQRLFFCSSTQSVNSFSSVLSVEYAPLVSFMPTSDRLLLLLEVILFGSSLSPGLSSSLEESTLSSIPPVDTLGRRRLLVVGAHVRGRKKVVVSSGGKSRRSRPQPSIKRSIEGIFMQIRAEIAPGLGGSIA
jgi:hypothetical protein